MLRSSISKLIVCKSIQSFLCHCLGWGVFVLWKGCSGIARSRFHSHGIVICVMLLEFLEAYKVFLIFCCPQSGSHPLKGNKIYRKKSQQPTKNIMYVM